MADDQLNAERITAPLEQPPLTFKVKLEPTHKDESETVQAFTYPRGDGLAQWSLERHGLNVEFPDLGAARSFMATAVETGALRIADSSPTKLK